MAVLSALSPEIGALKVYAAIPVRMGIGCLRLAEEKAPTIRPDLKCCFLLDSRAALFAFTLKLS